MGLTKSMNRMSGSFFLTPLVMLLSGAAYASYGEGQKVQAGAHWYTVAPADEPIVDGYPLLTTGGLKLFVEPAADNSVNVKAFAALGDGVSSDETPFNIAVSYAENKGGGTINVPVGDYPVRIQYAAKNVRIVCELGTILRGATTGSVVRNTDTVTGPNYIYGADIRGQTQAQEGVLLGSGYENTKALHGFEINGPWFTAEKCKLRGFRYDSLYGRVEADVNGGDASFNAIDCDFGDCARNVVSIVAGHNYRFDGECVAWNEGVYTSSSHGYHSLYLFDIEPAGGAIAYGIYCTGMKFLAGSPVAGSHQFITGDPFTTDGYSRVYLDKCYFGSYKDNGASPANIRTRGDVDGVAITKGLYVTDTYFEERMIANSATNDLQDCHFTNISLGLPVFFGATLGEYSSLVNVQRRDGVALELGDLSNKKVRVQNCTGVPDRNYSSAHVTLSENGQPPLIEITGKYLDVVSSGWVDLLLVGDRGTFTVTVGGCDATTSAGVGKASISASASDGIIYHSAVNLEVNAGQLTLRWKDATDGALTADKRTLQIWTDSTSSNQFVAKLEVMSRYIGGAAGYTWLL